MAQVKVALAGLGAVGLKVAEWLDSDDARTLGQGLDLVAATASSESSARTKLAGLTHQPSYLSPGDLAEAADVVVECLPPDLFRAVAEPTVKAGKVLMPLSVTQLLVNWDIVDLATETGARIIVPTGALLGLDAVRAAAEGTLRSVTMRTRKPPAGLAKAPFVIEQGIDLSDLSEPLRLYQGSVRDAAQKFPANVNVAVALSLAGAGPDETQYEIWADPGVTRNTHVIEVDAAEVSFEMSIAGVPTEENPATGKLTPLSTIAALKALVQPLKIGS
ncbi:aspartate dehydrogenase [Hwanghaeella grinnelliae]|uniref:L-aspartate dehydrogenase n=1 Tax=Hwanghaeella grinnelliae TaxID=2500179 RepID=A0A437QYE0_9PROT|nr:aspartate dehydrogenase [Hwanghaeella grinnelliae]RVU39544.1 aspartate dehydrogenase [Hwanghaeella grinnelliae]